MVGYCGGSASLHIRLAVLFQMDPQFASEMPKYKHIKKGGISLFKGKAGKGMPEEVGAFLTARLRQRRAGIKYVPPPLYRPPDDVKMLPMRELRLLHRTWLTPHMLDRAAPARPLPPPFAAELPPGGDHSGKAVVLAPINPLSYIKRGANGVANGGGLGECPKLEVERHQAAASVVARKMMARLAEDAAWLRSQAAREARTPYLDGFDSIATATPSPASVAKQEAVLARLVQGLDRLFNDDSAAFEKELSAVLSLAGEGPPTAPEAARRARALAQWAGCERPMTLNLLAELLMCSRGEAELRALNPLLSENDAAEALSRATALLLRVSRATFAAKVIHDYTFKRNRDCKPSH